MKADDSLTASIAKYPFPNYATSARLRSVFADHVGIPLASGYDRVGFKTFDNRLLEHCDLISRKVASGTYRFIPYRERLFPKTANERPRQISIPTIRDRLLLSLLKEYIHLVVPQAVPKRLPSEYVRELKGFLSATPGLSALSAIRLDIQAYYPSIRHSQLLQILDPLIVCPIAKQLVWSAVRTPTLSIGTTKERRRKSRSREGVPQGLPVSNVLANAYLLSFDSAVSPLCHFYARYVDDLLLVCRSVDVPSLIDQVSTHLNDLGLQLNHRKRTTTAAAGPFDFLGYSIDWPQLTVRRGNRQRFIDGIARLFARYRHQLAANGFPAWLSPIMRQSAFVGEVNQRITGAISGRRRYGWVFYFLESNDRPLLKRMDNVIASMFRRLPDFAGKAPKELKKLVRTSYEALYSPDSGYIFDYNRILSQADQLAFLLSRGAVSVAQAAIMTPEEVSTMFVALRNRGLRDLDQDVGFAY